MPKEFEDKSTVELERLLLEKREALRTFRFEMAGSKIKNVKAGRAIRTAIAQILTEINAQRIK
ncbi:MAG: 50S ribosomal protein L29 [Candidatus Taylorbacteria bacterium]|nr:50S ribosomal protein L29 [Candidatus Taylorbacteria bacterium]